MDAKLPTKPAPSRARVNWIKAKDLLKNAKVFNRSVEERKEGALKNKLEEVNTVVYRTKYKIDKLKATLFLKEGGLLDKNEYLFLNQKYFDSINVISKPSNSGSDSVVVILKKAKQQFILKLTFVDSYDVKPLNYPDTEAQMYNIMDILVRRNITPHVFMLVGCFGENVKRSAINPAFNTWLKKYNNYKSYVYPILTETSNDDSRLMTLHEMFDYLSKWSIVKSDDFICSIYYNIIFQIMYTIQCFIKVGIKHNDLHSGNIFILMRPQNIIKSTISSTKKFCRRYKYRDASGVVQSVLIPNIGLDVRIFDFDRSVKHKNDFRYYPDGIKTIYMKNLKQLGSNDVVNPHSDTYKLLCHLFHNKYVPKNIILFVKKCFSAHGLSACSNGYYTLPGKTNKKFVDKPSWNGHRYYLLLKPLPDGIMKSNLEILEELRFMFETVFNDCTKTKHTVLETYSCLNIEMTEKERVLKTLKARELAKQLQAQKGMLKTPLKAKTKSNSVAKPKTVKKYKFTKKVKVVANTKEKTAKEKATNAVKPKRKYTKKPNTTKPNETKATKREMITSTDETMECDDSKSRKARTKTSLTVDGKKRWGKMLDTEEKNCRFPFKYKEGQGRGKKALMVLSKKCVKNEVGNYCATERNKDCTAKKIGYCLPNKYTKAK
jgi:hypothetical protein